MDHGIGNRETTNKHFWNCRVDEHLEITVVLVEFIVENSQLMITFSLTRSIAELVYSWLHKLVMEKC